MKKTFFYLAIATTIIGITTVVAYGESNHKPTIQSNNQLAMRDIPPLLKESAPFDTSNQPSFNEHNVPKKRIIPSVQNCQVINWEPNHIYTITASINIGTHIIFPETGVDAVVGNKELWKVKYVLNHVFLKPTATAPEGELTSLTFVGDSNTSYEFMLHLVPDDQVKSCVIIERCGGLINEMAWRNFENKDKKMMGVMAAQFDQEKKEIICQQQNALDKYRGMIYTRYTWPRCSGWFGKDYVSDVYDDSRWTYVRVNDDSKAVMAMYGEIDGKKNLLEYSYDETTKIYRINGIYQKLILAYGKETLCITRHC